MEERRLKLGIIFNFNPIWMGGIIYILNLIRTLGFLDEKEKPEIFLFYRPDLKPFADRISYPYLHLISWNFPPVTSGYFKSWLTRRNVFVSDILAEYELDGLYPLHDYPVRTRSRTRLVSWYADLQHEYYPEFFTKRKVFERTQRIKLILRNTDDLVVSSKAVADDFHRFFRITEAMKMHVFHFVSVIDDLSGLDIDEVRAKYNLPADYYMISNQFHRHKNHRVLLRALALLKEEGKEVHMAMTGRFPDASHSPYMRELHSLIDENGLKPDISLLGVIPRDEQLLLMKHSRAVIQPSLFEGWSTVIEDAISLQVPVIASSLPVNIEQLGPDGFYFEPDDYKALAGLLTGLPAREKDKMIYPEYNQRIREAARTFMKIFTD
ncbi:MAG TPA: glycosyltransferase [Bacteroidales bacterium]|nr:glycosyltransferase [Bacteroidales bacterium]HPR12825.1 glycosyltransferase [Bacteroidales bacterium]